MTTTICCKPWAYQSQPKSFCLVAKEEGQILFGNQALELKIYITRRLRKFITCSEEYPSNFFNTSSVCSPNLGGASLYSTGVSLNFNGEPTSFKSPISACCMWMSISRASTCGMEKTLSSVLIGPQGIPAASNADNHSFAVFRKKAGLSKLINSSRFFTRSAFESKRGS